MEEANERRGLLRSLWSDRIVPALSSEEQTFGRGDSSGADAPAGAAGAEDSVGRRDGGATRERVLTPEERIVELLARHGGQMRQGEVVSNIEWSESTVSRKLQQLESTGDVTRHQLGREKLVYLPGHEPDALESPFARAGEENAPLAR